jgi:hypothetical protein
VELCVRKLDLGPREGALQFFFPFVIFFRFAPRWRSSVVEHLICNQRVGGSNPSASSAIIF